MDRLRCQLVARVRQSECHCKMRALCRRSHIRRLAAAVLAVELHLNRIERVFLAVRALREYGHFVLSLTLVGFVHFYNKLSARTSEAALHLQRSIRGRVTARNNECGALGHKIT